MCVSLRPGPLVCLASATTVFFKSNMEKPKFALEYIMNEPLSPEEEAERRTASGKQGGGGKRR